MKFEDFIARFDKPKKTGTGWVVKCPSHQDGHESLSITEAQDGRILVKCFAGCSANDVVAALGLTVRDLFPQNGSGQRKSIWTRPASTKARNDEPPPDVPEDPKPAAVVEKIYSYTDATGNEVYQALRYKPKTFRQRHMVNGEWVWNMTGVERVLYRLPKVIAANVVAICEGERDVETWESIGWIATTNVGGAGKWLDAYSDVLKGKNIVICGDNDKAGQDHVQKVFESLAGKAASVRIIKVPQPCKDITDYIATFENREKAVAAIMSLVDAATPFVDGLKFPVYSMAEIEPRYARQAIETSRVCYDFSKWLPSLGKSCRPMIPGEVALIIADTGSGKTNALQNIARSAYSLRTLMFELELPEELLFERFISIAYQKTGRDVEESYRNNGGVGQDLLAYEYRNLLICPESGLTLDEIERLVMKSELKFGDKCQLVLIDYAQLVGGTGDSRYERMSNIGEGIKVLARRTRTIVVVSSQMSRQKEGSRIPTLHSARDSSSLENSAGVVIGLWRDNDDASLMNLRVLKATKGGGGFQMECNFDGAKSLITERAKITEADIPKHSTSRKHTATYQTHNDE